MLPNAALIVSAIIACAYAEAIGDGSFQSNGDGTFRLDYLGGVKMKRCYRGVGCCPLGLDCCGNHCCEGLIWSGFQRSCYRTYIKKIGKAALKHFSTG